MNFSKSTIDSMFNAFIAILIGLMVYHVAWEVIGNWIHRNKQRRRR